MKTIIEIGGSHYTMDKELSTEQMLLLLNIFRGMRNVRREHTSNYRETRFVVADKKEKCSIALENPEDFMSPEQFEAFKAEYDAAHAEKEAA